MTVIGWDGCIGGALRGVVATRSFAESVGACDTLGRYNLRRWSDASLRARPQQRDLKQRPSQLVTKLSVEHIFYLPEELTFLRCNGSAPAQRYLKKPRCPAISKANDPEKSKCTLRYYSLYRTIEA